MKKLRIICFGALGFVLVSCGNITREDGIQTAGALGGGALGYSLADDDDDRAAFSAGGALLGGLASSQLAGNQDYKKGLKDGKELGFEEGQADASKRLYWTLQQSQSSQQTAGNVRLQEVDIAPTYTEDGRYLMSRKVIMPIVDPSN